MKSWVLWHKPGNGLEPSVKRVYLDGERAREDYELLLITASIQWQLDEFDVFGPVPALGVGAFETAERVQERRQAAAAAIPPPAKPVPKTFVEECMANPHAVVAWCRTCDAPADNIELSEENGQLTAIITHHGESTHMVITETSGTKSAAGSIMVNAFKPDAAAA